VLEAMDSMPSILAPSPIETTSPMPIAANTNATSPSLACVELSFSLIEMGPIDRGVWFCDEMRVGLHGQTRRVWAPIGVKVTQPIQIVYRWTYLMLAVNPIRGELRWSWIANMKGESMALILIAWKPHGMNAIVWDGAPGHRGPLGPCMQLAAHFVALLLA